MHRLTSRITTTAKVSSLLLTILLKEAPSSYSSSSWPPSRCFSTLSLHQRFKIPKTVAFPGDLVKWGSLGFCRTSRFASGFKPLEPKPLDSIMDLNRANNLSPEDLASIWDDYHLGRGHIGLTMKAKLYHLLEQRSSDCRYFVVPLWRGSGYTTMFAQGKASWLPQSEKSVEYVFLPEFQSIGHSCACHCNRHSCNSPVLKIIKQEELEHLRTSLQPFTRTLLKARTWYLFVEILFSPASLLMRKQSGSWKPLSLFI